MSVELKFLDYIGETSRQQAQVMREYGALLDALIALIQEIHPELSFAEAFLEARQRYQDALRSKAEVNDR